MPIQFVCVSYRQTRAIQLHKQFTMQLERLVSAKAILVSSVVLQLNAVVRYLLLQDFLIKLNQQGQALHARVSRERQVLLSSEQLGVSPRNTVNVNLQLGDLIASKQERYGCQQQDDVNAHLALLLLPVHSCALAQEA